VLCAGLLYTKHYNDSIYCDIIFACCFICRLYLHMDFFSFYARPYVFTFYNKIMLVYHTVNGVHALFHTSKTAKIIKVILLRTPSQNVNVLLSNITFIIFAFFDV